MKNELITSCVRVGLVSLCLLYPIQSLAQKTRGKWRSNKVDTVLVDTLDVDSTSNSLIPLPEKNGGGILMIHMDSAITSLYNESAEKEPVINGFRIQIYFGDLESARAVRAKCRKSMDHSRIYLESITPNYSVAIGDYRDRWEAELALAKYKKSYRDALIVPAEIALPDLD